MLGCKGPGEAKDTNIVELSEKVFEKVLKNILNFPQNLKWDSRTPGGGLNHQLKNIKSWLLRSMEDHMQEIEKILISHQI